ncbi:uncharacterized protein [Odocoileus virginianus]|uniref:Uncharacterized protein n=1 Tax=Odocoileus virginianus TaxID=9874 RepID=A0ABM4GWI0_ODOVR
MRRRAEKDPVPNAISAEGVGGLGPGRLGPRGSRAGRAARAGGVGRASPWPRASLFCSGSVSGPRAVVWEAGEGRRRRGAVRKRAPLLGLPSVRPRDRGLQRRHPAGRVSPVLCRGHALSSRRLGAQLPAGFTSCFSLAVFCRDPGIWAQTDLPEVYQNPLEEIALPVVSGNSAIRLLPLLFILLFILCLCCCGGQHGSADNETKSQPDFNSSNPRVDFSGENPHDVSVHLPSEEDRQRDMHVSLPTSPLPWPLPQALTPRFVSSQAHPEECPWGSSESSAEPHQDSFTQSELSLPSCSPEESSV